jgi:hypothetical protein
VPSGADCLPEIILHADIAPAPTAATESACAIIYIMKYYIKNLYSGSPIAKSKQCDYDTLEVCVMDLAAVLLKF